MKQYIEKLELALIDILDGNNEFDLQSTTGLSSERCKEIYKLYLEILVKHLNK